MSDDFDLDDILADADRHRLHQQGRSRRRSGNRQHGNVGNLGDVLKHIMLTKHLLALRRRYGRSIAYRDTHAFLLEALPAPGQPMAALESLSRCNVNRRDGNLLGYQPGRPYRCSAGRALDILGMPRQPGWWMALGEKHRPTRIQLLRQLMEAGIEDPGTEASGVAVCNDFEEVLRVPIPREARAVVALVDPFRWDDRVSEVLKSWTENISSGVERCTIVLYGCWKQTQVRSIDVGHLWQKIINETTADGMQVPNLESSKSCCFRHFIRIIMLFR